jgi:hypothetical protein
MHMAFFIIILPLWLNTLFSRYAWTDKRTKSNVVRIVLPALGSVVLLVCLFTGWLKFKGTFNLHPGAL